MFEAFKKLNETARELGNLLLDPALRLMVKVVEVYRRVWDEIVDFFIYLDWFAVLLWAMGAVAVAVLVLALFVGLARGGAIHVQAIPTTTPYPHGYRHQECYTTFIPISTGKSVTLIPVEHCYEKVEP